MKNYQNDDNAEKMISVISDQSTNLIRKKISELCENITEEEVEIICEMHRSHLIQLCAPFVFTMKAMGCDFKPISSPEQVEDFKQKADSFESFGLFNDEENYKSDDSDDLFPFSDSDNLN